MSKDVIDEKVAVEVTAQNDLTDPSTPAAEVVGKHGFAVMNDSALMNELVDRSLEVPLDNGKLVRRVALKQLAKWEEASVPLNSYRRMRVVFHRSGKEAEAPYVFMSLNGRAYQAPYEVEVSIPEPVIRGCIDTAVTTEYDMKDFDPIKGCTNYTEKVIRAVPYTFLGYENPTSV